MGLFKKNIPEQFIYVSGIKMTTEEMANVFHDCSYSVLYLDDYELLQGSLDKASGTIFKMYDNTYTYATAKKKTETGIYKTYLAIKKNDCYHLKNSYDRYSVNFFCQPNTKNAVIIRSKNLSFIEYYLVISAFEAHLIRDYENGYKYDVYVNSEKQNTSFSEYEYVKIPEEFISLFGDDVTEVLEVDRIFADYKFKSYYVKREVVEKKYIQLDIHFSSFVTTIFGSWATITDYNNFVETLKQPHHVYKIIGTNKPPYFIINDKIIESNTENWYEFCLHYFFNGKVQKWMLEKKE